MMRSYAGLVASTALAALLLPSHADAAPSAPRPATVDSESFGMVVTRVTTEGEAAPKLDASAATSRMDIDRDGKDEIVVGGGNGVVITYSGLPHRDHISTPIPSGTSPNFGDVMTSGDFDGDGYADLAISNPGERTPTGAAFGGGVWIFYGGATGLHLDQPQHVTQDTEGVPDDMEEYDFFGGALAAGDLNGDGRDDLAVGAKGETVNGAERAGAVFVLYGSATGLTTIGAQLITQDTEGVPSHAEPHDGFGTAVAIGDMTGDGYDDLAVSAPFEGDSVEERELGIVMLLPGSPDGVTTTGVTFFLGRDVGASAIGDTMSIGDIDGDGDGDLVAGAPRSWIGYVVYVPGSSAGMDVARFRTISMETPGVPGDPYDHVDGDTPHADFGYSLATGDVTGDGRADVLTGAITYDVDGVQDAGAVLLIPGTADGLTGAGSLMLTQYTSTTRTGTTVNPLGPAGTTDYFGRATSILNLDGSGPLDMLTATDLDGYGGLVVRIGISSVQMPRSRGTLTYLSPLDWWTGDDISAYGIGYALLHR